MRLTYIEGTVASKKGKKATLEFFVDSGAIYSLLPEKDWRAIGISVRSSIPSNARCAK
jgi:hypothetical protein